MNTLQVRFLAFLPRIEAHANVNFRSIRCDAMRAIVSPTRYIADKDPIATPGAPGGWQRWRPNHVADDPEFLQHAE